MSTKENLKEIFSTNKGEFLSGEELAERLSVSRTAVWKAVNSLREEGYEIEAVQNKGYRFAVSNDIISEKGIKDYLKTDILGSKIEIFDEIASTNTYAKTIAMDNAPDGMLIIAEEQTGGRGRFDRVFYSPKGMGIYMTFIIHPELEPQKASMITSCAAVAVAEALEKIGGTETKIKWVNDVYIGGKKVCGILTEAGIDFESSRLQYAVVGMGINIFEKSFPKDLADKVGSVAMFSDREDITRNEVIAEILNRFEYYYNNIESMEFLSEYRRRSNVIGKEVEVIGISESYKAKAVDINDDCSLKVQKSDGTFQNLNSGEVSIRPENCK